MARKNQKHRREQRREQAEARQAAYAAKPEAVKAITAGKKETKKIMDRNNGVIQHNVVDYSGGA